MPSSTRRLLKKIHFESLRFVIVSGGKRKRGRGWVGKRVVIVPNVQENCRRKSKRNVSRNGEKSIKKVLERTSAVLLQLRVDRRCLKYKKRGETNREKKGKREL